MWCWSPCILASVLLRVFILKQIHYFLCFGVFSKRYIWEALLEWWGTCPLVLLKQRGVFPCPPPPIENLFSDVPCPPILSLFLSSPQTLTLLSLFAWNKCHFPCPPKPCESQRPTLGMRYGHSLYVLNWSSCYEPKSLAFFSNMEQLQAQIYCYAKFSNILGSWYWQNTLILIWFFYGIKQTLVYIWKYAFGVSLHNYFK